MFVLLPVVAALPPQINRESLIMLGCFRPDSGHSLVTMRSSRGVPFVRDYVLVA